MFMEGRALAGLVENASVVLLHYAYINPCHMAVFIYTILELI